MKKMIILLMLYCFNCPAHAQEVYVWCPEQVPQNPRSTGLNGKDIDLMIYDARQITNMTYVKCSPGEVADVLAAAIQSEFPDARFHRLDSASYQTEPVGDHIHVKIGIAAYHSASGSEAVKAIGLAKEGFNFGEVPRNKWVSLAGFRVSIITFEGTRKKTLTKDIGNIVTRPEIAGHLSAKKALAESYKDAFGEVIRFIDSIPAQVNN